jgi:holo-[acyl-carrier protein] synthase
MENTMIIGVGTDIIRVSRVRKLAERFPERIGMKVFTTGELQYCLEKNDAAVSLAARFAAKEAVMKALGTGWRSGVRFIDIEVVRASSGQPSILLHGKVAGMARDRGISAVHISLSHDGDLAIATAIAEAE